MIGFDDVVRAGLRIAPYVRVTPVLALEQGAFDLPGRLILKLELLQRSGAFKARGAFNALLAREIPAAGVIAASGGNHGLAVAVAAQALGYPARIFVPASTPEIKVRGLEAHGAEIHLEGREYAEALALAHAEAVRSGVPEIHAYDDADVVAGQGTVGLELARQVEDLDTVLVAVGGGGLIGGLALALPGHVRIVAVEPLAAPTLHRALEAGGPVDVEVAGIASDALGARRIGDTGFSASRDRVDRSLLVGEADIVAARRSLWSQCRVAAEPGGAVALAALTSGAYVPSVDERVAVIICGGNSDPCTLA